MVHSPPGLKSIQFSIRIRTIDPKNPTRGGFSYHQACGLGGRVFRFGISFARLLDGILTFYITHDSATTFVGLGSDECEFRPQSTILIQAYLSSSNTGIPQAELKAADTKRYGDFWSMFESVQTCQRMPALSLSLSLSLSQASGAASTWRPKAIHTIGTQCNPSSTHTVCTNVVTTTTTVR
jgi:hypothetical protein